jgi:amidohydrolase
MTRGGETLRDEAARLAPELIACRRDLHRHPELGFEERRTEGVVAARLAALGLEVRTGLARTGVVGLLRAGQRTRPGVLLRADMDALPIQEVEGREYGSTIAGCMHACGHDGHTAMLLGAAALLAARRATLNRDVVLCFQPAEEGGGGAQRMIEDGVLDWVEVGWAFGLHLWSPFAAGSAHVRCGPTMAAQDEFRARIIGRAGHAALPHAARDPIVAAALGIVALQSIVSRAVDPIQTAVVSVGQCSGGSAPNVIPGEVRLAGTLRSFDESVRALLRERVSEALAGAAAASQCTAEVEIHPGYPAVVNDPQATEAARQAARAVFGEAHVHEPPPLAAAEDFAYFLRERPGAFVFVGAGNPARGISAPHHSPEFDIDESVLPRGAELLARLALG